MDPSDETPVADQEEAKESLPIDTGMKEAVKYMARTFLDESHYKKIHQSMANQGDSLNSLSAAIMLMQKFGVVLSPQEEERLKGMEESKQINALVMKMPQQSNDQFQQFFLQLQLLVSTATRVRQGLEENKKDAVVEALDDAESMAILPYILRMGIVQAGAEVVSKRKEFLSWTKDTDSKMGKLIRGQEDAMSAQKRLAAAQAQLGNFTTSQNEKSKKMLMNFASGSEKGLRIAAFNGWAQYTKQSKKEAAIRVEFEDRIQMAEDTLVRLKQEQLAKSNGLMMKKAAEGNNVLLRLVIRMWWEDIDDAKTQGQQQQMLKDLEEKLSQTKSDQKANTKRVMAQMQASDDASLLSMCFNGFVTFHQDYQKNKELEDQVKKSEGKVADFLKNKNEGAKQVLQNISSGSDTGLVHTCFASWTEMMKDLHKEQELQELMEKRSANVGMFSEKNKASGMSAMERAKYALDQMVMLRGWGAWKLFARVEGSHRGCTDKVEAKRQQLVGVQSMFRNFATQLETGLKASQVETTRDVRGQRMINELYQERKGMHKSEGTVSLPDINQKQGSGRKHHAPHSGTRNQSRTPTSVGGSQAPPPRTAWG